MVELQTLSGQAIQPYIADLARLRIQVFREYPYLYIGDLAYESQYLHTYAASPASFFVLALDQGQVVGVATGVPMADETPEFKRPFIQAGWQPEQIFYYGESVLLPAYRGQGWGGRFLQEREAHARQQGFAWAAFCAVERPRDHPCRPPGYRPLNAFWQKRGYRHYPQLQTYYSWKELGESQASPKPMSFWLKQLEP
nr:GNAT family N-acetyltransferase [Balneatrix alpica]